MMIVVLCLLNDSYRYSINLLKGSLTCFVWMIQCAAIPIMLPTIGSAEPRYQATSTKGDTGNGDFEGRRKKQYSTDVFSESSSKSSYFKAFGVDLSPDNMAVAIVYFVQGVLGLSRLAVSFYLKDDLQLDPAEVWRRPSLFASSIFLILFFKSLGMCGFVPVEHK